MDSLLKKTTTDISPQDQEDDQQQQQDDLLIYNNIGKNSNTNEYTTPLSPIASKTTSLSHRIVSPRQFSNNISNNNYNGLTVDFATSPVAANKVIIKNKIVENNHHHHHHDYPLPDLEQFNNKSTTNPIFDDRMMNNNNETNDNKYLLKNNDSNKNDNDNYKNDDNDKNHSTNYMNFFGKQKRKGNSKYRTNKNNNTDTKNLYTITNSILVLKQIYKYYYNIVQEYLYPSSTIKECQLFRYQIIAIPICYFMVGLLQGISSVLINVLSIDLYANEAQQMTLSNVRSLPASFKLLFGFISDTIPLYNYRRKSYMFLGWLLTSISLLCLLFFTNIQDIPSRNVGCFGTSSTTTTTLSSATSRHLGSLNDTIISDTVVFNNSIINELNNNSTSFDNNHHHLYHDNNSSSRSTSLPSIQFVSICLFGFGIGYWLADVMADSMVAERAKKYETSTKRGSIQSTCYACRFFGKMIGTPFGTYIYSIQRQTIHYNIFYMSKQSLTINGPWLVILILCILPLLALPTVLWYDEQPAVRSGSNTISKKITTGNSASYSTVTVPTINKQCTEIWNTVCSRAVWQPMGFVYLYNLFQVSNAAWKEYLVTVLHFTSCQLNMLLIIANVLLYCGIVAYKYYFINMSWRLIYIVTTSLNGILSILQILLIKNITFGINPFLFTLGDDAIVEFIIGIQFLPTTIMMVHLCPIGSEGASYAMFTTVNNSALALSNAISTKLLHIWDVSKTALQNNNTSGMINLTILTTCIQVSAIAFVGLLPHYKDDLLALTTTTTPQVPSTSTTSTTSTTTNSYHTNSNKSSNVLFAHSKVGGFIFLLITFGSILYAISIGTYNIFFSN